MPGPAGAALRPATEADLERAFAITWRCDHGPDVEAPTGPERLGYLRHSLATGRMVVAQAEAQAEGEVVGFAAAVMRGGVTMLADLFIDPPWHGRGIGSALLDAALADAWPRQTFSSAHPNALPLYVRAGMAPRWLSLYLKGDPSVFAGGDGTSAVPDAHPTQLAELERSWGGVWRPEDHAYWGRAPRAISIQIRRRSGEPFGFGYLAFEADEDPGWWISSMSVSPEARPGETIDALRAVFAVANDLGTGPIGLPLPGPHPATVPLLRAGWRIEDRDIYVASEPGLLDPERRIPDPTFA